MRTRSPRPVRRGVRPDRRPGAGVVKVSYRAVVNPRLSGPLTFRMKEGSSQWWFAVLVGDHGNPLRSVEVRQNGSWRAAQRQDYNYWLIASGAGPGRTRSGSPTCTATARRPPASGCSPARCSAARPACTAPIPPPPDPLRRSRPPHPGRRPPVLRPLSRRRPPPPPHLSRNGTPGAGSRRPSHPGPCS
ncbi:hypothetical protein V2I01_21435 [Micromonospora sp. BRA006-A]|nr:hypothetical protein [Micromonospora sp. BRA006-A]